MSHHPSPRSKAFTLLELIVVIVILGILAAIAVPTFGKVIDRSKDEKTLTTLRAVAREAQALRGLDQKPWTGSHVGDAAGDAAVAAGPGTTAAAYTTRADDGNDPSRNEITYFISGENLGLSTRSASGRICVLGANHTTVNPGSCSDQTTTVGSNLGERSADGNLYPGTPGPTPAPTQTPQTPTPSDEPAPVAPGRPTGAAATAGDGAATVTFTPGSTGTAPVTYTVKSNPGNLTATGTSPVTVTGLSNGVSYTFTVTASNAAGAIASDPTNAVTPTKDLSSSSWTAVTSLSTARSWTSGATDTQGRLYALGGQSGAGTTSMTSAERYDPATETWSAIASMPTGRQQGAAAADPQGRIYAIGGYTTGSVYTNKVERYDPTTNTWTAVAPLPVALGSSAAVSDSSGRIYVSGGLTGSPSSSTAARTLYRYDPTANTWTSLTGQLGTARSAHAAAIDPQGRIYAIGGYNGAQLATGERYDPTTNTWTAVASMGQARTQVMGAADQRGRVYVLGNGVGGRVERYDPTTNTWTDVAALPDSRYGMAIGFDKDGRLYSAGGANGNPFYTSSVYRLG